MFANTNITILSIKRFTVNINVEFVALSGVYVPIRLFRVQPQSITWINRVNDMISNLKENKKDSIIIGFCKPIDNCQTFIEELKNILIQ